MTYRTLAPLLALAAALPLAGCKTGNEIDIIQGKPAPTMQTRSRSEPIFYNGKTYHLDFSYAKASNSFDMRVSGMSAKQQKDAVAVATSGLRYYSCPDGQDGQMLGQPRYADGIWRLQARCA